MNMFNYIGSNNKVFRGVLLLLFLVPIGVQLFFSGLTLKYRIVFTFYSFLFLFLGYIGMYLGLRLSNFLLLWKRVLNIWCNFFIVVGLIASLLHFISNLQFINTIDDALRLAFGYAILGMIIGAYRFQKKYILA